MHIIKVSKKLAILCFAGVMAFQSCDRKAPTSCKDFIKYIEEQKGFNRKIQVGGWEYNIQYKPAKYMVCKANDMTNTPFAINQYKNTVWFNVKLRRENSNENPLKYGVSNMNEYNSRLNYFLYDAGKNFSMQYGSETNVPMIGYQFENNFGLTPMDVMVIGFAIPDTIAKEDIILTYDDVIFNNGIIKVKISAEDLRKLN